MTAIPDIVATLAAHVAALPVPVALLGYGVEGRETLRFLRRHGLAGLRVYDRNFSQAQPADGGDYPDVTFDGAADWEARLSQAGTVIRSAGVRPDLAPLERARARGAQVLSATQLFLRLAPGPVAGVTGTLGKGTTVTLIGEALGAAGLPYRLGGNIGLNPLAFLDELTRDTRVVLELSSFQLMDLRDHHPPVAVVLRTTSEHLDWHRDVTEYRRAKQGLIAPRAAGQRVIYCADSPGSREVVGAAADGAWAVSLREPVGEGIGLDGTGTLCRFRDGRGEPLADLTRLALPGAFNRENAAAALLAAEALAAKPAAALTGIRAFPGLPHRLERVGEVNGVVCYNDSYATRPDATLGAVSAFDEPLVLIVGGSEKHADFRALMEALCAHPTLRLILFMGTTGPRMETELAAAARRLGREVPAQRRVADLPAAVKAGLAALAGGGVLLMSPACASFDMFPNYTVRGEHFRELVAAAQG